MFRGCLYIYATYRIKPETTRLETGQKKTHVLIGSNQPAKNRRCFARACACMIIHSFIQVNQVVVKTSPVEKQLVVTQIMLGYVIYDRVTDSRSGTLFSR